MTPPKIKLLAAFAVSLIFSALTLQADKYENPNTVPLVTGTGSPGTFAPTGNVEFSTHGTPTMNVNCDGTTTGSSTCSGVVLGTGNAERAVFNFNGVSIPSGVTLSAVANLGSRPLVILSKGDMTIQGTIDVKGATPSVAKGGRDSQAGFNNHPVSGGYIGTGPGSGGGMQGDGGNASGGGTGLDNKCFDADGSVFPAVVAGIATGGGGGDGDPSAGDGGGGGGGLELGTLRTFSCNNCFVVGFGGDGGTGYEGAGGGAGGGLIVHANVISSSNGAFNFRGGHAGDGSSGPGGGGGGGGRILFAYAESISGISNSGTDGCGLNCDGDPQVSVIGGFAGTNPLPDTDGKPGSCRIKQDTVPIPEPSEYALMFGVAAVAFVALRRRFTK